MKKTLAVFLSILMMLMMVVVTVFDFGFVEKKVHYQ